MRQQKEERPESLVFCCCCCSFFGYFKSMWWPPFKNPPQCKRPGFDPGLGWSPGEGTSYLLQYSGLENSMDCTVHGVTKSRTRLSKFHFHLVLLSIRKGGCYFLLLRLFCLSGRKTHNSHCSEKIIILFTCMGWNWNRNWKQEKKKR